MCALISINGVEKYELKDGAYNRESFLEFLVSAQEGNILTAGSILVLDNVPFHHYQEVKAFFWKNEYKLIIFISLFSRSESHWNGFLNDKAKTG